MKLFYTAGSCSMSCHIALEEAGLNYTGILLDFDKPDASYAEMEKLNPLGVVPVLVTDDGKTLTQNAAILEYIADKKASSHLMPAAGTFERAQTVSWLSFVAADLHKAFAPLFGMDALTTNEAARAEIRTSTVQNIKKYLGYVDRNLAGKDYLTGKTFTVADSYLFTVVGWCQYVKIPTDEFKNLTAYQARVYQRPAVQRAMKQEGLLD